MIELNDNGCEVANILFHDYEYENIFMTESNGRNGQTLSGGFGKSLSQLRLGVVQSAATKNNGCANLKSLLEDQKLIINDFQTISELTTFASKGRSYEAEEGKNDDLVMTLVLFAWLARQQMFKELVNSDFRQVLFEAQQRAIEESMLPLFSTDDVEIGDLGKL